MWCNWDELIANWTPIVVAFLAVCIMIALAFAAYSWHHRIALPAPFSRNADRP